MTKQTAYDVALETRKHNHFPGNPEHYLDTRNKNAPAWSVRMNPKSAPESAIVVYDDDPSSVCSVGAEPGRWLAKASS